MKNNKEDGNDKESSNYQTNLKTEERIQNYKQLDIASLVSMLYTVYLFFSKKNLKGAETHDMMSKFYAIQRTLEYLLRHNKLVQLEEGELVKSSYINR